MTPRSSGGRTMHPGRRGTMRPMDLVSPSPLARLRALPPRVLDTLIALAVGLEAWAEVLLWSPLTGTERALGLTFVTLMAIGCGLRRASPFAAITLSLGGLAPGDMLGPAFFDHTAGPFFS